MRYKPNIIARAKTTYNMCHGNSLLIGLPTQRQLREQKAKDTSRVSLTKKFFNKKQYTPDTKILRPWEDE